MRDLEYTYLKARIKRLTGIDLGSYREQQMRRRLSAFVSRTSAPNVFAYCRMIEHDSVLINDLRSFLTIKVSEFFRDLLQFEQLKTTVLPRLLAENPCLNIWSTGCSIGGEPYSLAIILNELYPYRNHRILATDIDDTSLMRARAGGPYRSAEIKNVPEQLLQACFSNREGSYWVSDKIRRRVEFRKHDLLCDPFEEGFDLIACRNVAIYFTDEARLNLNCRFHRSLRDGGILFVGGTETIMNARTIGFTTLDHCFYVNQSKASQSQHGLREIAVSVS